MSSVAERVSRECYGLSADPAAPENKDNTEFLAGFKKGQTPGPLDALAVFDQERIERRFPQVGTFEWHSFQEWKRGYWAGLFTRLENEIKAKGEAAQ